MQVHSSRGVARFGPYQLDPDHRRLTREGEHVWLPDRQLDVLLVLVAHAGHVVSKNALTEAAWRGAAVTDNSVVQAIRGLRDTLGPQADGAPYIETRVRQGYRFLALVQHEPAPDADAALDALVDPYLAFIDGRAALETLDRAGVVRARQAFEALLLREPSFASAHIGLANAHALAFEATRADAAPDHAALPHAERHAREGCRLAPTSAEAWSTLAFVQHRRGHTREALAAARRAVALEPDNWRHHVRMASVSWGEERLRAAQRSVALCSGLALGHWFVATVFVAREAYEMALEALRAGCEAQDAQRRLRGPCTAMGLHLLHGLVLAASGALDAARHEFARELAFEDAAHVYARERGANTWYALGALHLREGCVDEAHDAFHQALQRVPGHPFAVVGMAGDTSASSAARSRRAVRVDDDAVHAAIVSAAVLARGGRHDEASRVCGEALVQAEPGQSGWILPVEPLLHVSAHRSAWASTLATLRARAV